MHNIAYSYIYIIIYVCRGYVEYMGYGKFSMGPKLIIKKQQKLRGRVRCLVHLLMMSTFCDLKVVLLFLMTGVCETWICYTDFLSVFCRQSSHVVNPIVQLQCLIVNTQPFHPFLLSVIRDGLWHKPPSGQFINIQHSYGKWPIGLDYLPS